MGLVMSTIAFREPEKKNAMLKLVWRRFDFKGYIQGALKVVLNSKLRQPEVKNKNLLHHVIQEGENNNIVIVVKNTLLKNITVIWYKYVTIVTLIFLVNIENVHLLEHPI